MKEVFVENRLKPESLTLLEQINGIVEDYTAQGYRLTLRQLYYQLVTKNIVTNTEKSYDKVGRLVSDGRLMGLVDWDAIEDRVRVPKRPNEFTDLRQLVDAAVAAYRLPRWDGQDNYVELWVEKDALAGVLQPIASEFHVTLMVNRGYSSQSAMYESAKRFIEQINDGKEPYLLYLGDHDPSGEDMVRDVRDRLKMFEADVTVRKLALTMAQVREYDPPPNPAKVTDSRASKYIAEHGESSWEVDALPPEVLREIIETELRALVDQDAVDVIKEREESDKKKLVAAASRIVRNSQ